MKLIINNAILPLKNIHECCDHPSRDPTELSNRCLGSYQQRPQFLKMRLEIALFIFGKNGGIFQILRTTQQARMISK
jgi:hypothetical protein